MLKQEKIYAVTGAVVTWSALVLQLVLMFGQGNQDILAVLVQYFSYYTILTNLLVAIYFTTKLVGKPLWIVKYLHTPAGATGVALHITIVGLVYQLLLRNIWNPQGALLLADYFLHAVIPLYFVLYWLLLVPKKSITYAHISVWLLYPVLYLLYTLIHGAYSGFYPYPFVHVTMLGYPRVFTNSAFLTLAFITVALVYVSIAKLISRFT